MIKGFSGFQSNAYPVNHYILKILIQTISIPYTIIPKCVAECPHFTYYARCIGCLITHVIKIKLFYVANTIATIKFYLRRTLVHSDHFMQVQTTLMFPDCANNVSLNQPYIYSSSEQLVRPCLDNKRFHFHSSL
jgi:hypothetical protein